MSLAGAGAPAPPPPLLPPGYRLQRHDSLPSTMDEARRAAEAGEPEVLAVWAGEQTAGRGRQGRGWSSPPGNLYLTLLLRPEGPPPVGVQYGFLAGLALAEALSQSVAAERIRLKWPNDVMLDGAKMAGILLESRAMGERLDWLLIGMGVNLASAPADTPYRAAFLAESGVELAPGLLLERLLARLAAWRERLAAHGFAAVRQAWLARAYGLGRPLTARLPQGEVAGRFEDLDADGALVLLSADGARRRVTAADVQFG